MPRIGVTGHMDLTPATEPLVRAAIREALQPHAEDLVGVSCLAAGSDTIFAEVVLDLGGQLEVIVPAADYRERRADPTHFDDLVARASGLRLMPSDTSGPIAYEAANEALLTASDRLVAIWDGRATDEQGGTAAMVRDATAKGVPVDIVWPEGAARASHS